MTCDYRILSVMIEVIKYVDFAVLFGYRNEADQEKAFEEGNSKLHFPHSRHNQSPSLAVDIVPWFDVAPHIRWSDPESFHRLAGAVLYEAARQGIKMTWGGDWETFKDLPHFQVDRE